MRSTDYPEPSPAAEKLRQHLRAIWNEPHFNRDPSPAEVLEADEYFAACDRNRARKLAKNLTGRLRLLTPPQPCNE